jgi:hypothetical protein
MKKLIMWAGLIAIVAIAIAVISDKGSTWADTLFKQTVTDDQSAVKKWTGGQTP